MNKKFFSINDSFFHHNLILGLSIDFHELRPNKLSLRRKPDSSGRRGQVDRTRRAHRHSADGRSGFPKKPWPADHRFGRPRNSNIPPTISMLHRPINRTHLLTRSAFHPPGRALVVVLLKGLVVLHDVLRFGRGRCIWSASTQTSVSSATVACPRGRTVKRAQVAQLVEHRTENAGVGGSNPPLGTTPSPCMWIT